MHSVQSLQAEIADLRLAMAQEEFEDMPPMLDAHDLHLREYAQQVDIEQDRDALQTLLTMHQDLMRMMRERQRKLLELIRAQRTSSSASRAYARVGRI
ncbi:hypothetical protein [Xanthomonas vasicola]|uniref:hypothetical protein n=1 Tax=Xanthomonas vasicola TaxID=56459 RepID=UPI0001CC078F|nr:hypothetical protein [Xanthomonas vasicola]KFA35322.1 hypothetical protein KWS_0111515 [Xanthomonas vasicola pv. musacearum NCPPB 4384]AZR30857.1 hypothetical protein KWO_010305 [Xanthomonas vasicola pv. musacearum NCPPB 4379]KFA05134.1 hypothetical protein KWQ_0120820 [Xanthomonas vasicola pv. musacearum NCPPB 4380]KFA10618.1 hypothetical protein KWM_0108590 [Xanthomonas vasicola pv. musacearum NCPPB 2005]KFA16108.1 hypothetical protein A11G_0119595 [Xanthomonas vasicola pv. musacearum NCP